MLGNIDWEKELKLLDNDTNEQANTSMVVYQPEESKQNDGGDQTQASTSRPNNPVPPASTARPMSAITRRYFHGSPYANMQRPQSASIAHAAAIYAAAARRPTHIKKLNIQTRPHSATHLTPATTNATTTAPLSPSAPPLFIQQQRSATKQQQHRSAQARSPSPTKSFSMITPDKDNDLYLLPSTPISTSRAVSQPSLTPRIVSTPRTTTSIHRPGTANTERTKGTTKGESKQEKKENMEHHNTTDESGLLRADSIQAGNSGYRDVRAVAMQRIQLYMDHQHQQQIELQKALHKSVKNIEAYLVARVAIANGKETYSYGAALIRSAIASVCEVDTQILHTGFVLLLLSNLRFLRFV